MKQKIFLCCMLMGLFSPDNNAMATESDVMPQDEGWSEVTDLSSLTLSDYYFSFYERHDMMLDTDGKQLWLKFPASPLTSRTKLWTIEPMTDIEGKSTCYTLRNFTSIDYVMTVNTVYGEVMGASESSTNSAIAFTYNAHTSGYWALQACSGNNSASTSNNYIGPWSGDYFNNQEYLSQETVCATNKNKNDNWKRPIEVKIYAIQRDKVEPQKTYTPLVPAWALGHIVWEDEKNTQDAITDLIDQYLAHGISVDATIIDSPWSTAYNNFIWDRNRYPDSDAMIDNLNQKGVKVMLWLTGCVNSTSNGCPQDKCEDYDYAVAQGYGINDSQPSDWWKGNGIQIDFTSQEATQWWYQQLDKVYRDGIYGFKVDQGEVYFGNTVTTSQGTMSNADFRPYYYNAMERYIASKRNDGFNISRPYSHQGGYHADPTQMTGGWCGDFGGDWGGLQLQIDNVYRSAQKGYGAIGTEVAGFMGARANKEQFIRYVQFGAMTACIINGGENGAFSNHLPWWHGTDALDIYSKAVELHNRLRPYLFSTLVDSHFTGCGLIQDANLQQESHRLGTDLFTKAITSDKCSVKFNLPDEGEWIEWFTRELYQAGQTAGRTYGYDEFPLFIRRGSILPTQVEGKVQLLITPSDQASQANLHLPQGEGVEYTDCNVSFNPITGQLSIEGMGASSYSIRITEIESVSGITGADSYQHDPVAKELIVQLNGNAYLQLQDLQLATLTPGQYHDEFEAMLDADVENPFDATSIITDAACKENHSWAGSGRITQSGQHWSGESDRNYYSCNYSLGERTQKVTFPKKGVYELDITLRGEAQKDCCTLTLGDIVYTYQGMGYTGGTVATDGSEWASPAHALAAGKTMANGGEGYGWFVAHLIVRTQTDDEQLTIRQQLKSKDGATDDQQPSQCGGMKLIYYGNDAQTYNLSKNNDESTLTGVIAHGEMPETLVESGIVAADVSKARICDFTLVNTDLSPNAILMTNGVQKLANSYNVWADGHIATLKLTDGFPVSVPDGTTAEHASYLREEGLGYGTLCLPIPLQSDDELQLYTPLSYTPDGHLIVGKIEAADAGRPVIFMKQNDNPLQIEADKVSLVQDAGTTGNDLVLIGCFAPTVISQQTEMYYSIEEDMFVAGKDTFTVPAFRAYLDGHTAKVEGIEQFLITEEGTAIHRVKADQTEIGPVFNLQGQRIDRPSKGIYLQGGRKVLIWK